MSIEDARIAQEMGTQARSLCGTAWIWPKPGKADVRTTADLTSQHCLTCRKIVANLRLQTVMRHLREAGEA